MMNLVGPGYNPGYTQRMKTAISIPDRIYEAADELARRLGLSRSELYSRAVAAFVEQHRGEGVTEALDRFYAERERESDPMLDQLQEQALRRVEW